jgi:hypothetical protein
LIGRSVFGFAANRSSIFAATDSGVFSSTDYGTNWSDISTGMNHIYVSSLFVSGSYLYASTSNGLMKRPLSEITSVEFGPSKGEIPKAYTLAQNYPNPFNPETTIRFGIPQTGFISLKIFNILGEEIATLISENLKPGIYSVHWNATPFASGIYFYQLRAGSYSETKKLILLK